MSSQCTCTTDKEATCIVHPTTRSLKEHIAELEAEVARLHEERDLIAAFLHEEPPFDDCAGVDLHERAAFYSEQSSPDDYYRAFIDCCEAALEAGPCQ